MSKTRSVRERAIAIFLVATMLGTATVGVAAVPGGATGADVATDRDATADAQRAGVEIVSPANRTVNQSTDTLDVAYRYNISGETADVTIKLVSDDRTYSFDIDGGQYVNDGALKTVTLDLAEKNIADDQYSVVVEVTDASGNTVSGSTGELVVINDDAPSVGFGGLNRTNDVAPGEDVNVTFSLADSARVPKVTVAIANGDRVVATKTFTGFAPGENGTTYTRTVTIPEKVPDNVDYRVVVIATDESGFTSKPAGSSANLLDVNAERPTIERVETDVRQNLAIVVFNEPVVALDGTLSPDDFAYQDVNGAGAREIQAVRRVAPNKVVLKLDANVTATDLKSDLVSARANAIADADVLSGANDPRIVNSSVAIALKDTTPPTVESVTAGSISAKNSDSYVVKVRTTVEPTDVTVELTGPNGNTVSNGTASATGRVSVPVDASSLADGNVTVTVTLEDVAGNTASSTVNVTKDTAPLDLVSVEADPGPGGRIVYVTFDDDVAGVTPSDFSISGNYSVDDVLVGAGRLLPKNQVLVLVNRSIAPSAVNSSAVQLNVTGVTDGVGNPLSEDTEMKLTDRSPPVVDGARAREGSKKVVVRFSETVTAADGGKLTAANFTYVDGNNESASTIVSATQVAPNAVVLTLDEAVTAADIVSDDIAVGSGEVVDTAGKPMARTVVQLSEEKRPALQTERNGNQLTVTLITASTPAKTLDGSVSIVESFRTLTSPEGFELDERFSTVLSPSDFTVQEPGVFEATVTLPDDGPYRLETLIDGKRVSRNVVIDTERPHPTDAVVLGVTSAAQPGETRNTTRIRVLFNEPIDASEVSVNDIEIEGFEGKILEIQSAGPFGAIDVIVEGKVSTGDSPKITVSADSYTDMAGNSGVPGSGTVVHTDILKLQKGANLVSVPATTGGLSVEALPLDKVDVIWAYNATTDSFESFDPDAMENDFTMLKGGKGYIIEMKADANVPVNVANTPSTRAPVNDLTLDEGFNLIGHYQEDSQRVRVALSSLTAGENGDFRSVVFRVLRQAEGSAAYEYETLRSGEFSTFQRGEAYWVFVSEDQSYTEAPFSGMRSPLILSTSVPNTPYA